MTMTHRQPGHQFTLPNELDKKFILIVDNHPASLSALSEILASAGLCSRIATDGESALALVKQYQPDLILLDVQIPGMDGFETCRRLKENPTTQPIPVILTLPLTDTASKAKGFALGAIDYLPKPFDQAEVLARLGVHLQLRQLTASWGAQAGDHSMSLQAVIGDRNAATAELQQKIQMLDVCNDAIMIRGLDGVITYWNQGAQRLYGWAKQDAIGKITHTLFQTFFPKPLDAIMADLEQQDYWEGELTHVTQDGKEIVVLSRWTLQRDQQGQPLAILESNNDITTRKQAEAALRISEKRFRDVTEAAGEYIWEINVDGVYTFVTDRAKAVKGYSPAELLGQTPFEFMPLEDVAEVRAIVQAAAVRKAPFTLEHRDILPNGEVVWEAVSGVPILNDQDDIIGFRGTGLSITERKQAEAELQAQEQLLRSMYEGVKHSISIVAVSEEGEFRFVGWNRATEKITGIPSATIAGKTPEELLGEVQGAAIRQNYQRCLKAGRTITYEECVQFQGRNIWWLTTLNPLKDDRGHIYRLVITTFDISDRKAAEAALQEKEAQYRSIFEAINDGIFITELETGRTVTVNPAVCEMHGYTYEEFIKLSAPEYIHPDTLPKFAQFLETTKAGNRFSCEGIDLHRNGTLIDVAVTGVPFLYNERLHCLALVRDITEQKRLEAERQAAEAALQQKEAQYRAIFESINDGIVITDLETGAIATVNPAACDIFGYTAEEFVQLSPPDFVHPDSLPKFFDFLETLRAGNPFFCEATDIRQGGTLIDVEVKAVPLIYRDKPCALSMVRNISDRKQAEAERKAAEHSQARLTAILEATSDFVGMADMQGRILYINQAGKQLLGISPEEDMVGLPIDTTMSEWAKPIVLGQGIPTALQIGIWQGETAIVSRRGSEIPVSQVIIAHKATDGTPEYLSTMIRDITDQKQAEASLQQKAQREQLLNRVTTQIRSSLDFNVILTTALDEIRHFLQIDSCAFVWCHLDAEKPYWNAISESRAADVPSYLGRYPLSAFSVLGDRILNLETVQVDDASTIADPTIGHIIQSIGLQAALMLPMQFSPTLLQVISCSNRQVRHWSTDEIDIVQAVMGQLAIALNQANLYEQSQTRATELATALQELQRTQAQLVQSEKMSSLGQLVAGIAHEINNPVNFIHGNVSHIEVYIQDLIGLIELYQREFPQFNQAIANRTEAIDLEFLSEDLPKLLNSMRIGTERICEIVRSLRIFSRLDEAEVKAVDIHEGIDSTLMILQSRLKAKSDHPAIQVIKNYGSLPRVECFAGQLNQVFMNILANAIDALEERNQQQNLEAVQENPSTITITTALDAERQVTIEIADNGPGMPESVQQRLFDPFFTTKPVGQGTGMGLSISYQIVTEKHQGALTCTSSLGQGTKFTIRIPLKQAISSR